MEDLLKLPNIIDRKTGEVLRINEFKPKKIKDFLKTMDPKNVSSFLTRVNFLRKTAEKVETITKDYVKEEVGDFEEEVFFEDHRIKKISVTRFNENAVLNSGNARDIADWNRLKKRYSITSSQVRFG